MLLQHGIQISMDGKGRYKDNIFVERLWRSLKYEEVYLKGYQRVPEARADISSYLRFYNEERPHQAFVVSSAERPWGTTHRGRCSRWEASTWGPQRQRTKKGGAYSSSNWYHSHG